MTAVYVALVFVMMQGLLEVLEYLTRKHLQPKRTFYLAFGHDEEVTF